MKKYITKYLKKIGFVTSEDYDDIEQGLRELSERVNEDLLNIRTQALDYDGIYQEAVEINNRLKKLEEYLDVEYKLEMPEKIFIGYKKKR